MDDSDTATIELTRPEAREVINALSAYRTTVSDDDETRTLEIRDLLQREFGFKEDHFEGAEPITAAFGDVFDDDGDHEIQLSRAEATEVVPALAELETDAEPSEAETIADIRSRFEDAFDLDSRNAT